MRIVLDTNVIVSALLIKDTPPDSILQAWSRGAFEVVTTTPLMEEIAAVLRRPKIRNRIGWSDDRIAWFVASLGERALIVAPSTTLSLIQDEADNRLLEAASEGLADYIVTGDGELLGLHWLTNTEIVTPARFLAILASEQGS